MNFVADESLDKPVVDRLRQEGYSVSYIAETNPRVDDECVLHLSRDKNAVLITCDKDFGELVFRQNRVSKGIILVRLSGLSPHMKASLVFTVVEKYSQELNDKFTVITPGAVRIRKSLQ